jgi:hypothetical protein
LKESSTELSWGFQAHGVPLAQVEQEQVNNISQTQSPVVPSYERRNGQSVQRQTVTELAKLPQESKFKYLHGSRAGACQISSIKCWVWTFTKQRQTLNMK